MKKVKNIKLEQEILNTLFKQALDAGFNNLQNYLEHILIEQSKK